MKWVHIGEGREAKGGLGSEGRRSGGGGGGGSGVGWDGMGWEAQRYIHERSQACILLCIHWYFGVSMSNIIQLDSIQ